MGATQYKTLRSDRDLKEKTKISYQITKNKLKNEEVFVYIYKGQTFKTTEGFWWPMFIVNRFRYLPNVTMFASIKLWLVLPSGEAYDCLIGTDGF